MHSVGIPAEVTQIYHKFIFLCTFPMGVLWVPCEYLIADVDNSSDSQMWTLTTMRQWGGLQSCNFIKENLWNIYGSGIAAS